MAGCQHNRMTERKDDPVYAWQCADCGYVYGRDEGDPAREAEAQAEAEAVRAQYEGDSGGWADDDHSFGDW